MIDSQLRELRTEHVAVNAQSEAMKAENKHLLAAKEDAKTQSEIQVAALRKLFEEEKAKTQKAMERLQEENVSLESEVETLRERDSLTRDGDLENLCEVKREAEVLRLRLKELTIQGSNNMSQKDQLIYDLQEKVKQGDKMRRTMHNTIQELRGNVRVFARTRPFLPSDQVLDTSVPAITCEYDGQTLNLRRESKSVTTTDMDLYTFTFDKVFSLSAGQDTVFEVISLYARNPLSFFSHH